MTSPGASPFEVELKFRLADPAALQLRLSRLGAVPKPAVTQVDDYLTHPCRDFVLSDEALRIRSVGNEGLLTYKGPSLHENTDTRTEIEIPLSGLENQRRCRDLFERLGFQRAATVIKRRQPFELEWQDRQFYVVIDDVPPLGPFLEIELLVPETELAASQHALWSLAETLGLTTAEEKTYLELILSAGKPPNPIDSVGFDCILAQRKVE